jgi:hypothetical protein
MAQQPLVGQGFLIIEASRSHSDTPHSVGLLWTGLQPDAETSNWQHTTLQGTDVHDSGGIRTRNPSKREVADQRLRPRGHWERHKYVPILTDLFSFKTTLKAMRVCPVAEYHVMEAYRAIPLQAWTGP